MDDRKDLDEIHPTERQFTQDWFSKKIPQWEKWLGDFRGEQGIRALEIGCFEGRSTVWLCENILTADDSFIDCVDLFQINKWGDYHQRFLKNTVDYQSKIREYAGPSFEILKQLEGPYEIIYVDGAHSAFAVLADGLMSWPLLAVGGVMIFDDYYWLPDKQSEPAKPNYLKRKWLKMWGRSWRKERRARAISLIPTETPKLGVDGLLATLEGRYELLGITSQLAIRKISA